MMVWHIDPRYYRQLKLIQGLFAGRQSRGPGICRRLMTSRTNCWDGQRIRQVDIEEFAGDNIEDQGTVVKYIHTVVIVSIPS